MSLTLRWCTYGFVNSEKNNGIFGAGGEYNNISQYYKNDDNYRGYINLPVLIWFILFLRWLFHQLFWWITPRGGDKNGMGDDSGFFFVGGGSNYAEYDVNNGL